MSNVDVNTANAASKGGGKEPSEADKQQLEKLRVQYENCKKVGCADEQPFFNQYHDLATKLLIDLSGKLEPGPEQEPDEGYVKPGGWQANPDPKTWKVVPMKDNPKKFKVVDDKGKNVATEFKTQAGAQRYIDNAKGTPTPTACPPGQHRDLSGKCVPDSVPAPSGNKDQFGIVKIHPDKTGGETNIKFELEEKERHYASGKPSEWSVEYTANASSKDHNSDVEATFYTKINGFKTNEADSISDKLTGPAHQDGACCWVIPDFMTDGSASKTLETEKPHPSNHGVNPKPLSSIGGSLVGKWFGHKAISYVKAGRRFVESWIHFPVDNIDKIEDEQGEWRQYIPITQVSDDYIKANGTLTTCRIDGVKKGSPPDFKYCSVREINPQ